MNLPGSQQPSKSLLAAVLVWALELVRELGQRPATVADALALTGSGRSQAYAVLARLKRAATGPTRRAGRPSAEALPEAAYELAGRVRDFLMDHPGVVHGRGPRRRYQPAFRGLVLALLGPDGPGADLTVEQAAGAVGVPVGTLKDWRGQEAPALADNEPADREAPPEPTLSDAQLATVLSEWKTWRGDFSAFCEHLRDNLRLPFGRTFISSVLQVAGLRRPTRRKRPREPWSRESFQKLFPGAQWLGDGKKLVLSLNGERFAFNFEAMVDTDSNAVVGVDVSDSEDEAAVIATFEHGLDTAYGVVPVGLSLDNRPSNHTVAVEDAVDPTLVVPSTPGRGQAKAPCEGAFGLFEQNAPPLDVHGATPRDLARSIVALVVTLWAWTRNHKPRRRLGGMSPAEYYNSTCPSPEQIQRAKAWMAELRQRSDKARQTRRRRVDPVRLALLRDALRDFAIADPDDRLAVSLARYASAAIAKGIAIYSTRKERGTLPETHHPGRYLGGIMRNIDDQLELEAYARNLRKVRERLRELTLEAIGNDAVELKLTLPPHELPRVFVERAIDADGELSFEFYLEAARDTLQTLPIDVAHPLLDELTTFVAGAHHADKGRRLIVITALIEALTPAS